MKVNLGIWRWLTQAIIALVVLAACGFILLTYQGPIQKNEQMRRKIDNLDTQLDRQRQIAKQLQAEFDALRSDPKTVERLAREKLDYAKADETVVHFDSPITNPPVR